MGMLAYASYLSYRKNRKVRHDSISVAAEHRSNPGFLDLFGKLFSSALLFNGNGLISSGPMGVRSLDFLGPFRIALDGLFLIWFGLFLREEELL